MNLYILSGMITYIAIPIIWKKHITNSKNLNIFIIAGSTYVFSSLSSACFIQTRTPSILGYILILITIVSFIVLVSAIHRVKVNAQETNHVTATPAHSYTKYLLLTGVGIFITALILNFISIRVLPVCFPYNIFVTPYILSILSSCLASLIFYCYFANTCTSKRVFWFFVIYLTCMTILQSFVIMLVDSLMLGYGLFNLPGVIFIYILLYLTVMNKKLAVYAIGLSVLSIMVAIVLFYVLYNTPSHHSLMSQFIVFHMSHIVTYSSIMILWTYEHIKHKQQYIQQP